MAVIRASRPVCDSGDGSGTEEEINKPGCLRADAVSKPTATDLSAQTQRERSEYKCRKGERGKVWETGGWRINNRNSKNHWKDRKSRMRSQLYLLDSIKCRTNLNVDTEIETCRWGDTKCLWTASTVTIWRMHDVRIAFDCSYYIEHAYVVTKQLIIQKKHTQRVWNFGLSLCLRFNKYNWLTKVIRMRIRLYWLRSTVS